MASVASQPPSIIARVDRLDLVLGYLEEMRSGRSTTRSRAGTASTSPSSSGPLGGSECRESSVAASSPRSLSWRRCRPAKEVLEEAQAKGSLVDRINLLEIRVLKMEEDMEIGGEKRSPSSGGDKKARRKGLKKLVESCVRGDLKTKE